MAYKNSLETESNRALHDARVARRGRLAELVVDLLPGRVELGAGVDLVPVHRVEQVVDLPANLHPLAAADTEVLEHRQVGVPNRRPTEEPRRGIAEIQPARRA